MSREGRRFIRHPTEVPIKILPIEKRNGSTYRKQAMNDVSHGGLSFQSEMEWPVNTIIKFRIDAVTPPFEAIGKVVWCQCNHPQCYIGVVFMTSEEAFEARMVEQVCQIEQYRKMAEQQGRIISSEEAAVEWIAHHAADFPPLEQYSQER